MLVHTTSSSGAVSESPPIFQHGNMPGSWVVGFSQSASIRKLMVRTRCEEPRPQSSIEKLETFEQSNCYLAIVNWRARFVILASMSTMRWRFPQASISETVKRQEPCAPAVLQSKMYGLTSPKTVGLRIWLNVLLGAKLGRLANDRIELARTCSQIRKEGYSSFLRDFE